MAFFPKLANPNLSAKNNINFVSSANQAPFYFGGSDVPSMLNLKTKPLSGSGFSNKNQHQKISGNGLLITPSSFNIISKTFKKNPIK